MNYPLESLEGIRETERIRGGQQVGVLIRCSGEMVTHRFDKIDLFRQNAFHLPTPSSNLFFFTTKNNSVIRNGKAIRSFGDIDTLA